MNNPKLSAHRGGPEGIYPPNSFVAIDAALNLGVDMIEFDVRTTKDNGLITFHDSHVDVEGKAVRIDELTEDEVLFYASDAARVSDVLARLKGRALGHVDLKDTRLEIEVADLCSSALGSEGFILTTLEDISVKRIRRERPNVQVALSLGRDTEGLSRFQALRLRLSEIYPAKRVKQCDPTILALNYKIAKLGALRWAMRKDIPVLLWTVNDVKLIRQVANDNRYWGYTTDFPKLALSLRDSDSL